MLGRVDPDHPEPAPLPSRANPIVRGTAQNSRSELLNAGRLGRELEHQPLQAEAVGGLIRSRCNGACDEDAGACGKPIFLEVRRATDIRQRPISRKNLSWPHVQRQPWSLAVLTGSAFGGNGAPIVEMKTEVLHALEIVLSKIFLANFGKRRLGPNQRPAATGNHPGFLRAKASDVTEVAPGREGSLTRSNNRRPFKHTLNICPQLRFCPRTSIRSRIFDDRISPENSFLAQRRRSATPAGLTVE